MIKSRDDLEHLLANLKEQQQKANEAFAKCPPGNLVQIVRDGKKTYFQVTTGEKGRKRTAINKRPELVRALARKKYLEIELQILEQDIAGLEKLLKGYLDAAADVILARLPKRFQALPEDYFFSGIRSGTALHEAAQKWAKAPYEQSTYDPWEREHTTARGLKVRSKSEVIIAERLDAHDVPYRYEQMLHIEQYSFSPDFTIWTSDGLKYWEHCGRVNDTGYMRKHKWKVSMYEKVGIVPWRNLIVTYDDEKGGLDSRIIESEIINKLL